MGKNGSISQNIGRSRLKKQAKIYVKIGYNINRIIYQGGKPAS